MTISISRCLIRVAVGYSEFPERLEESVRRKRGTIGGRIQIGGIRRGPCRIQVNIGFGCGGVYTSLDGLYRIDEGFGVALRVLRESTGYRFKARLLQNNGIPQGAIDHTARHLVVFGQACG